MKFQPMLSKMVMAHLKTSSLIGMSRALDLELMLVPRQNGTGRKFPHQRIQAD